MLELIKENIVLYAIIVYVLTVCGLGLVAWCTINRNRDGES